MAIPPARWGADCDENRASPGNACGQISGEVQPTRAGVDLDQFGQARFKDRHDACVQQLNLGRVLINADHIMAEISKASPGHEAHIT